MFTSRNSKGFELVSGIVMLLAEVFVVTVLIISMAVFVKAFKYHVYTYILSGKAINKASLIPLAVITSTYEGDDFIIALNEIQEERIRKVVQEAYLSSDLSYSLEVEGFFIFPALISPGDIESEPVYSASYPTPIVFNGEELTKELTFKAYRVGMS